MRKILISVAMLGLGACALPGTMDADAIAGMSGASSPFNDALHTGYASLGKGEYDEADWCDGDHFLGKAEALGGGASVGPDMADSRRMPEEHRATAAAYYTRLTEALASDAAARMPAVAAKAQVAYDCWLQEAEENHQAEDIAACQSDLDAALAQLAAKPMAKPVKKAPMVQPKGPNRFVVWFDLDSAAVSADAGTIIKRVADAFGSRKSKLIQLVGHTDTSGADAYNKQLSIWRAEAVKEALTKQGIAGGSISTKGVGENLPAVKTGDGVANAANRRVEIRLK
ncbi:MAG: OmpA family protein [Alphaproteobacteria bacterium]